MPPFTFLLFRRNNDTVALLFIIIHSEDGEGNVNTFNTFIQTTQNISGYLTYCIRKRKRETKHNLTETTNRYKVQNSVSKNKQSNSYPVIKLQNLNKIRLINNIIISVFLLSAYVRFCSLRPHAPNASK